MKRLLLLALVAPALLLDACASDPGTNPVANQTPAPAPTTGDQQQPPTANNTPGNQQQPSTETPAPAAPEVLYAFVGSGDGKLRTYKVDEKTGAWTAAKEVSTGSNPWFVAFDPPHSRVVAIDEVTATVQSFKFDAATGALTLINTKPSGGAGPTHVAIDATGKWVTVTNFGEGNVTIRAMDSSGVLGEPTDTKGSLDGAHWAGIDPLGLDVYVAAVDKNWIAQFRLDPTNGKLINNGWGDPPPNAGPRHVTLHPNHKWVYSINEYANSVSAYYFDPNFAGKMWPIDNFSALPDNQSADGVTGAEIVMHPNGKWLYASTRGYNSVASFEIDQDTGRLTRVANTDTGASAPRSFAIDPEGTLLFAGNQDADQVVGFKIDSAGKLVSMGKTVDVAKPNFVGLAKFH
jgi:6-phosphogluconolactonase